MHTKQSSQRHPKVIPNGVKQDLVSQSLHPFWATTFTVSHFGYKHESFIPIVVHRYIVYDIQCHILFEITLCYNF